MRNITIFTDGSSRGNPGPGGWAAVIVLQDKDGGKHEIRNPKSEIVELGGREENTTNNRMELTAAIHALNYCALHLKSKILNPAIFTDSSYLINGITKWVYSWEHRNWMTKNKEPVLNKDLWEALLEVSRGKDIEWKHVGGHVGIAGNERADQIATAFADNKAVKLYNGASGEYQIKNILDVTLDEELSASKKTSRTRSKAKAHSYVSQVDGVIQTHATWAECERRVKGKIARFKKAVSPEEEKQIIEEFKSEL